MIAFTSRQNSAFNRYSKILNRAMQAMCVDYFNTKSAQKDVVTDLSRAYEELREVVNVEYLETVPYEDRRTMQMSPINLRKHELYCALPYSLAHFRAKHADEILALYPHLSNIVDRMNTLFAFRDEVRETPIMRVEPKAKDPMTEKVERTIIDIMAKCKADYAHGISLMEVFGYMNITASVHVVVNQYGTRFHRSFYYMDGRLTRLNVIIAVYQEMEDRKKKVA